MSKSPINVVLSVSHRFECLNVFLDILKNNFQNKFVVHVFCNLEKNVLKQNLKLIDFSLIDFFYNISDDQCVLHHKGKLENRRRQPLDFFINILRTISVDKKISKFIYSECDQFPLNEKKYISPLANLQKKQVKGRYIDLKSPKVPSGYLSPCPLYIHNEASYDIANNLNSNRNEYLARGFAFEGMVAQSIAHNKFVNFKSISSYFISNYNYYNNLEPISCTTHQHNIFNLRNEFKKRKIKKGKWVQEILKKNKIKQWWDGLQLNYDHELPCEIKPMLLHSSKK